MSPSTLEFRRQLHKDIESVVWYGVNKRYDKKYYKPFRVSDLVLSIFNFQEQWDSDIRSKCLHTASLFHTVNDIKFTEKTLEHAWICADKSMGILFTIIYICTYLVAKHCSNGELQKAERLIEFVKRLVREPTIIDRICATVGHAFESIRIIVLKTSCEILTSVCTTIPQTTELLSVLQKYIKRHFSRRHPFN